MRKTITLLFTLLLSINLFSQEIKLELDSQYISLGEWTVLKVISSGGIQRPRFRESKDLSLISAGTSSSFSNINGKTTQSTTYMYRVIPNREGELEIPVFFSKSNNGTNITSNKLTLFVEKGANTQVSQDYGQTNFETEYVMLFIDTPQRDLYVGESTEVVVRAYFNQRYGASISREPYINNGPFTLELQGKYKTRQDVIINGIPWIEAKWTGYLTPISTGNNNLSIKLESIVNLPLANSSFFSNTTKKDVETTTEEKTVSVLSLPQQGQPKDFNGAIGDFSISSRADNQDVLTGDPVTITIDIYGRGNFQRVLAPESVKSKNWKFYPPSNSYSGTNDSNFQGVKTFQQILTPLTTEIKKLPEFKFSYFNPIEKRYYTLKTETTPINIEKGLKTTSNIAPVKKVEFKNTGTILKHQKSDPVIHKEDFFKKGSTITVIIFSALLLLLALVIQILLRFGPPKALLQKKELLKIQNKISSFEKAENYTKALDELSYMIKSKDINDNINPNSITAQDLEVNINQYNILKKIEEVKYTGKEIEKVEYNKLKDLVIKELM